MDGGRRVNWVSWHNNFKSKEDGGLGIKDVGCMNVALLMKWKWRILTEENVAWSRLLRHRYINLTVKMFVNDKCVISKGDSIWWRDDILIKDREGSNGLSFCDIIACKILNGENISFWFSRWEGNKNISEAYLELYAKVRSPLLTIAEAGFREGPEWNWDSAGWLLQSDEDETALLELLVDHVQEHIPDSHEKIIFIGPRMKK